MYLHSMLISIIFTSKVLTTPVITNVTSKDSINSTTNVAIKATIINRAGYDVTSSFQIRLYYPEISTDYVTNQSLSNRDLETYRSLDICQYKGIFLESFCTPEGDKSGSLQSYTIVCRHMFVKIRSGTEVPVANDNWYHFAEHLGFNPTKRVEDRQREGHCAEDEICVPGRGAERSRSGRRMASCVRTELFLKYLHWGNNSRQGLDLEGKVARMVLSQLDGTTPIEADTLEADTETANGNAAHTNRCRDCVELKTEPFGPSSEGLKFQTRLLTTGAMAGLLWIAIASG